MSKNGRWHQATDQLTGTQAYGIPFNDNNNWSIKYSHMIYNQFMFTSGDGKYWMIVDKGQVISWYHNGVRQIVKSSRHKGASSGRWYRRGGVREDPWISLGNYND